jgi:hypothetical protein
MIVVFYALILLLKKLEGKNYFIMLSRLNMQQMDVCDKRMQNILIFRRILLGYDNSRKKSRTFPY